MTGQVKIPVLVTAILLSLFLAFTTFYLFQKERVKNVALQGELNDLQSRYKTTESKLAESKKAAIDLESQLQDVKAQIDTLNAELSKEKTEKTSFATQVDQLKSEIEQGKAVKDDLEKKLSAAQSEVAKAQEQMRVIESEKSSLESKLKEIEDQKQQVATDAQQQEGVQLGTIVVNPEASVDAAQPADKGGDQTQVKDQVKAPAATAGLEGKILVINKEYNFAVINLGTKDGINVGDVFSVSHDNKYIGDIKVEKVHEAMSAMGFTAPDMKDKISEGDRAVRK